MAQGPPHDDDLSGWLRGLKPGTSEGAFTRNTFSPVPTAGIGPIELSPSPDLPREGAPYALGFFGEVLRACATLPGTAGMAELARNVERYLHYTREKLTNVYEALRTKDRDTFSVIPFLLHANVPGLPGYQASDEAPFGVTNFELNATVRQALVEVFPGRRVHRHQAVFRPVVQSLLAMGSVGTIGQTGKSDIDYWVVVDEGSLAPHQQKLLLARIEAIETWARKRGLDCHFFLVDTRRAQRNDFGGAGDDAESGGSAQGKLLKEEFYRTAVFICGQMPVWWIAPVGVDHEGYQRLVGAIEVAPLPPSLSFVDLGYVGEIDRGEFFGAALWQVNKSLRSPFKSLLKMALLAKYLDEEQPALLCDSLKARVFGGESAPQFTDPYVLLFDAISEYFANRGDWEAFRLVQKCFYLKVGMKLSRQRVERARFVQRFKVMSAYINRWGWDAELLAELDSLETWSADRVDALGQEIRHFMLGLYRHLINRARSVAVRINETDVTILGRRLFACFGHEQGKVRHLFTYFLRETRTEERFVVLEAPEAAAEQRWEVHRDLKRENIENRPPPMMSSGTLAEVAAWLTFNGLFHPGTVVGLIGHKSQTTTAEFRSMLERFHSTFECPDPFSIAPTSFLAPRKTRRAAMVVNLDLTKGVENASEQAGVYYLPENWDVLNYGRDRTSQLVDVSVVTLNSWGEVFCRRYLGNRALPAALRELFDGVDPDDPMETDPEILAPQDRTLPAVRNRLREVLDLSRHVLLDELPPRESRSFVYEVGGRFQVVHRGGDGQRLSVARSVRGVARLLGNCGYDQQSVYIDRLSPSLGDLRAVLERHTADRDPHLYLGWRQVRDTGYVIVCDATRRVYLRAARGEGAVDALVLRLVRRVLQHLRTYVESAQALRRALRVFELRGGRALGQPTQLAEDTARVLGELAKEQRRQGTLWLVGDTTRGRQGVSIRCGDELFSPEQYGRSFALRAARRAMEGRIGYDPNALLIDGSSVDFGKAHHRRGYDPGVVKQLRLIDLYERWMARALAAFAARRGGVFMSETKFDSREGANP